MITKKLRKTSIFKSAIKDYCGYDSEGIERTIKILKLIEDIDTDKTEIVDYLNESLSIIYDASTKKFNKLETPQGITVKSNIQYNKNKRFGDISKFFKFIVVTEGYYGIVRMAILLVLNEGDSYSRYDMSELGDGLLFEEHVSFDDEGYIIRSNMMNKEQIKNSKNYNMKQLYKSLAEDMECLDDGDLIYMTEGYGINSEGEFKKM